MLTKALLYTIVSLSAVMNVCILSLQSVGAEEPNADVASLDPRWIRSTHRAALVAEINKIPTIGLRDRLRDAEARLHKLLPLDELFDQSDERNAPEPRFTSFVEHALPSVSVRVECHANLCLLDLGQASKPGWQNKIQSVQSAPPFIGMFRRLQVSETTAWFELENDESKLQAASWLFELRTRLYSNEQFRVCRTVVSRRVTLVVTIDWDLKDGKPAPRLEGDADDAFFECVDRTLRILFDAMEPIQDASAFAELSFPVEAPD